MKKTVITMSEAKESLTDLLTDILEDENVYILTRRGKQLAALVPISYIEED
jgi:prevent-host-death family protein